VDSLESIPIYLLKYLLS